MTQQIKTYQLDIDTELVLNANPTVALGAATKDYVDSNIGGIIASSYIGNGYSIFADGLIIQWGRVVGIGDGTTIVFPIAFPITIFSLVTTESNEGGNVIFTAYDSLSSTSFVSRGRDAISNTGAVHSPSWIAIGR